MVKNSYECCIDCKKRHPACHSDCEDYLETKQKYLDEKAIVYKAKTEKKQYDSFVVERVQHGKKRKNRHP